MLPNIHKNKLTLVQVPFFCSAHLLALLRLNRKLKPDVIHAHWVVPQGFLATIACRFTGTPLVVTAHGSDLFSFQKGQKKKLVTYVGKYANSFTVNSSATMSVAKDTFGILKAQIIHQGVDLSKFNIGVSSETRHKLRAELGIKDKMLLSVCRLIEWKGTIYLIKAMPAILEKNPSLKLVIVGEGPERAKLEETAKRLKVSGAVIFLGAKSPKDMPAIFAAADIYVGTSITAKDGGTEGLGIVILEALASNVPVVTTSAGGIVDIIQDEQTGLFVPERNSAAIAAAIQRIIDNKVLRVNMVRRGHELVSEKFAWDEIASQNSRLYIASVGIR